MKILNFGSLNVDHVYEMEHFVRPGETLSSYKLTLTCGGKGLNQSVALARAGAAVWHAGKLGADGAMLRDRLAENGVELSCLMVGDCPTGHAIIQVDRSGQNCIILFGGANRAITEGEVDEVLARFDSGDILLLQNEISCLGYLLEPFAHRRYADGAARPAPCQMVHYERDRGRAAHRCGAARRDRAPYA